MAECHREDLGGSWWPHMSVERQRPENGAIYIHCWLISQASSISWRPPCDHLSSCREWPGRQLFSVTGLGRGWDSHSPCSPPLPPVFGFQGQQCKVAQSSCTCSHSKALQVPGWLPSAVGTVCTPATLAPRATFLSASHLTCSGQDGAVCPRGCELPKTGPGCSPPVHDHQAPAPTPSASNHGFCVPGGAKDKWSLHRVFPQHFLRQQCVHIRWENSWKIHISWPRFPSISASRSGMEPGNQPASLSLWPTL